MVVFGWFKRFDAYTVWRFPHYLLWRPICQCQRNPSSAKVNKPFHLRSLQQVKHLLLQRLTHPHVNCLLQWGNLSMNNPWLRTHGFVFSQLKYRLLHPWITVKSDGVYCMYYSGYSRSIKIHYESIHFRQFDSNLF